MSTELVNTVVITPSSTDVLIDNQFDTYISNTHEISAEDTSTVVNGYKKEYSIVGDGLYASINASEAPTWLTTIIDELVASAVAAGQVNYDLLVQDVQNAIASIDVANNTYVEQINFESQVNALIATSLAAFNVSIGDTYATKVELTALESSATAALASEVTQLEAGYTDAINAKAAEIIAAYSSADAVNASNIAALTTVFSDQNSELVAQANALSGLQTYIGVDGSNIPNGTGLTKSFTDLSIDLTALDDSIYGTSGLEQSVYAAIDAEGARVEGKFAYNSTLAINGAYYTAGFGLDNSVITSGSGTELDPYDSTFWINAEKFKFTNTNQTGSTSPFTIDASGSTPTVTFNGVVSFSNISDTPTHTSGTIDPTGTAINGSTYTNTTNSSLWVYSNGWVQSGDPEALVPSDIGPNGTTIINGGLIDTGTITANAIAANAVTADKINVVELSAISATLGTFKSAATGERVEISDDSIRVYDTNGTLRVKIGNLL